MAKRKGKLFLRILVVVAVLVLLLILAAGALLLYYSSKLNNEPVGSTGDIFSSDVTNILLIGVDNDYAPGMDALGNADGLIIASINEKTKSIVLSSLMRDIKVSVPEQGNMKLTTSYHVGGVPLLIETIESNFGVSIDSYVLVNYLDVVKIVDSVGGVELDITDEELYHMRQKIENIDGLLGLPSGINIIPTEQAGTLTLNGVQTAAFMRVRMAGNNDVERTERARRVLLGLKNQVMEMDLGEINSFVETALSCIKTNIDQKDFITLAIKAPQYLGYDIVSNRVPVDGSFYYSNDGNAYVVIDFDVNKQQLNEKIYAGS